MIHDGPGSDSDQRPCGRKASFSDMSGQQRYEEYRARMWEKGVAGSIFGVWVDWFTTDYYQPHAQKIDTKEGDEEGEESDDKLQTKAHTLNY